MFSSRFRTSVAAALVVGTVATGCELRNPHDHGGAMVDEVRPEWRPKLDRAPYSAEYVLYGWQPVAPASRPTTAPAVATTARNQSRLPWERAAEVDRAFVARGRPLGFRRQNGQLLAVADRDVKPLPPGHYCWHLLPGNPVADGGTTRPGEQAVRVLQTVGTALVIAVVVVGIGWLVYHEVHHGRLIDDIANDADHP